jgi:hypothetical protein
MVLSHFSRMHKTLSSHVFERVMHDVGSSIPFIESSSHNSGLTPIFFRSARASPWSLVFLSVLSNVPSRLSHTFFSMCITSIE